MIDGATSKHTLILGATTNPQRYAYLAAERLTSYGHTITLVGIKDGEVFGAPIQHGQPIPVEAVDTITLYLGPQRQVPYYEYILRLRPQRIIFNPGTENPELMKLAKEQGIETVVGCTLVMLGSGQY